MGYIRGIYTKGPLLKSHIKGHVTTLRPSTPGGPVGSILPRYAFGIGTSVAVFVFLGLSAATFLNFHSSQFNDPKPSNLYILNPEP